MYCRLMELKHHACNSATLPSIFLNRQQCRIFSKFQSSNNLDETALQAAWKVEDQVGFFSCEEHTECKKQAVRLIIYSS